jgi:predicted RNase H-like HicB family nuclease
VPLPPSALESFEQQQRITLAAVAGARRAWSGMGRDFTASWRQVGPRLVLLVTAAQLASARNAAAAFPAMIADLDLPPETAGDVDPTAFAGTAADGRELDGLLYSSVTTAKEAAGQGAAPEQALERGQSALDMYVQTTLADIAREVGAAALSSHTGVTHYVRMLRPPSCPRCAVLAGRVYSWRADFDRHERCDCTAIPQAESVAGDATVDVLSAIKAGQVTGLNKADLASILDHGADPNQVINAKRGMSTAVIGGRSARVTLEGITKQGYANQVRREIKAQRTELTPWRSFAGNRAPRLTVWEIFRVSDDRDEINRLLITNGYITPGRGEGIADVARRAV